MSERKTHPNDLPFMVVDATSQANPPTMYLFASKKEALSIAAENTAAYNRAYHVFELTRIASVHPQPPKIYEE